MSSVQLAEPETTSVVRSETGWWSAIFPDQVNDMVTSCKFVKKLVVVGISNIVYLRTNFSERCFSTRNFDGTVLKLLRSDTDEEHIRTFAWNIRSALDALDKQYLRELILIIYLDENKPEEAYETYTFSFDYKDENDITVCQILKGSGDSAVPLFPKSLSTDVVKATKAMIRHVILITQNLNPLPDIAHMTLKLTYYDERTPDDYEPSGFEASDITSPTFPHGPRSPIPIRAGHVKTEHHGVKLKIKSNAFDEEEADEIATENCDSAMTVRCPCGFQKEVGLMIHCRECGTWQHGCCFCVISKDYAPTIHVCDQCSMDQAIPCTDETFKKMQEHQKDPMGTCLLRRILIDCLKFTEPITDEDVASALGVGPKITKQVMKQLIKESVITPGEGSTFVVNQVILRRKILAKHFGKKNVPTEMIQSPVTTMSNLTSPLHELSKRKLGNLVEDWSEDESPSNKSSRTIKAHQKMAGLKI